jgi:hypothetical protein
MAAERSLSLSLALIFAKSKQTDNILGTIDARVELLQKLQIKLHVWAYI